ncbi:nuclear transport factor 2 family protein [Acidobacteria bacterium AB60]|nr:nuclear transport factor 2 family protein [Acidobacteria bacterium AB60]
MNRFGFVLVMAAILALACPSPHAIAQNPGSASDRAALMRTGDAIRAAFAASDVDAILKYHHPEVEKWLSPTSHTVGRQALRAELLETFKAVRLQFEDNRVESTTFMGDAAVEVTAFTIRVTPMNGGASTAVRGRAMVVYVRSAQSPTGWLSLRELIQPAE